mgnify:CR=1 FL=1
MEVTELTAEAFWKGETEIRGTVMDGEDEYRVRILRKGSQNFDYSCSHISKTGRNLGFCGVSCTQGPDGIPMCPHAHALLAEWLRRESRESKHPVSTSQKVRFMVREYTNREVSRIMGASEEGHYRLIPIVTISRDQVRVRFTVGREKQYPVKDLTAFAKAMETMSLVQYGKGLAFHHSLQAFDEESRALALLIMERVGFFREQYRGNGRFSMEAEPALKELILGKAGRERFFAIMDGQTIECEDYRKKKRMLTVKRENPTFTAVVKKEGRDGIKVTVDKDIMAFSGEKSLFIADQESICRCDPDYTECLTVFMEYMVMGLDAENEVSVNDRDMPLFYERVLRKLEPFGLIRSEGVDLESYRPKELKASFYFDSDAAGTVTLRPELAYGDFSFHPLADENVPKEICRDVPGEFKVSQLITTYFKYTEDGSGNLVIKNDDEAVYRLISEGMKKFMDTGDVFVSESFKKIRVLPPVSTSVQVRTLGRWLELEVDTGALPREELAAVLAAYGKKKSFYRMKNGDFLTLGDGGLLTVAKIAEQLGVAKELVGSDTIKLPAYRAMFLDAALKEDKSVSVYRDQLFKAVVRGMKDVEDSDYEIPKRLASTLRSYQKVGYRWLKSLDAYGFGGILADEMGLGKTIQVIALLLDEKAENGGTSLVVCPASLVYNWENEFAQFAPELKIMTAAGNQAEREEMFAAYEKERPDVIITSYDLLKRDILWYHEKEFRFEIIDEAQYIKNSSTQAAKSVKAVPAKTRFALTGTPIENHLGELWSIFDFLMPGFLFTYSRFRKQFESPIVKDGDTYALESLRRLTGPFVLRRLKKDVLKDLPDKLETVVYSMAEDEQKQLYTAHALALKEELEQMSGDTYGSERIQVLAELTRLRQICCDPSLCFDRYKGGSAKLDTCMELITGGIAGGHKILLFSQFTSMLELIGARLKKEGITFHELTGATPKEERIRMAGAFQTDDTPVFLISLKAGGTGLNLTAADVVIHYDPWWNVAAQNQATDRAYRIGQEKPVTVYKLILKDTIEENLLKLQNAKLALAAQVVSEGMVSLGDLSQNELMELFEQNP